VENGQIIELLSALTCIWSIWLNTERKARSWPVGLISVLLAGHVYYREGLLAECALQVFYFGSGIYGWWSWATIGNNKNENSIEVDNLTHQSRLTGLFSAVTGSFILFWFLNLFPRATSPIPDAILTSFSLLAQLWLARRKIENWILWMVINIGSAVLYVQRELWFFAILYCLLFLLAVKGFWSWKERMKVCSERLP